METCSTTLVRLLTERKLPDSTANKTTSPASPHSIPPYCLNQPRRQNGLLGSVVSMVLVTVLVDMVLYSCGVGHHSFLSEASGVELVDDALLAHHDQAVAHRQDLR